MSRRVAAWHHTSKTADSFKLKVAAMITALPQRSVVYDAGGDRTNAGRKRQRAKRDHCLAALMEDAGQLNGDVRIVLDSHEQYKADEVVLYQERAARELAGVRYDHMAEQSEPLILVADAVAWFYAKGGLWPGRLGTAAERKYVTGS
jgi:hypothetical protein